MSRKQRKMIARAARRFGRIGPCVGSGGFAKCFTHEDDRMYFWYNSADGSTHVEVANLSADPMAHAG